MTNKRRFFESLKNAEAFVWDLDGTLIEGMPYEDVLTGVAKITGVEFDTLAERYRQTWKGVDEAVDYHLSLIQAASPLERLQKIMRVLSEYIDFVHAKSSPETLPGAKELLQFLREAFPNVPHICWTRGDEKLQRESLRVTGLETSFDHIIIAPKKTREMVEKRLLPVVGTRAFVMLGDIYESDIAPLTDFATIAFWTSGSKVNRYLKRPSDIAANVCEVSSVKEIYDRLRMPPIPS